MSRLDSNLLQTANRWDSGLPDTNWLCTIQVGCRLTFWFLLLPLLLTNVAGFALPFIGGNMEHLASVGLIYTFGGLPLLVGILKLTTSPGLPSVDKKFDYSRRVFRVFAAVDVVARVVNSALKLTMGGSDSIYLAVLMTLADVGWVVSAAVYLTCVCRLIGARQPVYQIRLAASAYIVVTALVLWLDPAGEGAGTNELPQMSLIVLFTGINVWGLCIFARFRRAVGRMSEHKCVNCGYMLKGLARNQCPECGTPFMPPPDGRGSQAEQGD